jgi:hypothetical protein
MGKSNWTQKETLPSTVPTIRLVDQDLIPTIQRFMTLYFSLNVSSIGHRRSRNSVSFRPTCWVNLWPSTALVIPAFLLHILNPRVFPIFDQHVERARRLLTSRDLNLSSVDLRIHDYAEYSLFWVGLLSDLRINIETAEYGHVKRVDEALWAMGKHLKQIQKAKLPHSRGIKEILTAVHCGRFNTSSPEFKNAVLQHAGNMRQSEAMKQAAKELGVHLPHSYLKYPGSHINRWRRQGFPK